MGKVAEQKVRMWLGLDAVWVTLAKYLVDHMKFEDLEPLNMLNGECRLFRMKGIASVEPNPKGAEMAAYYAENAIFVRLGDGNSCVLELPKKVPVKVQIDEVMFRKLVE